MANTKNKNLTRKHDPLPKHLNSLEEAGEFWDTHDSADYEDLMHEVECEVEIKRRVHLVSLDGELFRKVSAIAQSRGVSAETLVNLWVHEKAA